MATASQSSLVSERTRRVMGVVAWSRSALPTVAGPEFLTRRRLYRNHRLREPYRFACFRGLSSLATQNRKRNNFYESYKKQSGDSDTKAHRKEWASWPTTATMPLRPGTTHFWPSAAVSIPPFPLRLPMMATKSAWRA